MSGRKELAKASHPAVDKSRNERQKLTLLSYHKHILEDRALDVRAKMDDAIKRAKKLLEESRRLLAG